MHDKRRHPRVAVNIPIRCEPVGQPSFSALAVDLSMGGLLVEGASAPPFGTELTIVGDFSGSADLKLPSVVRWARAGGFGVQFGLLGINETRALTSLLKKGRPTESP